MTFPSSRFNRNRQPTLKGNTLRVKDQGVNAHNELSYARDQVITACRRTGALMVHWRRYTPEFNNGTCPVCMNQRLNQGVDPDCPNCFGVGFDGGFSKPSIQHMIVGHSDRRLEATNSGFVRLKRLTSKSPYLPNMSDGDIIGEIRRIEGTYTVTDRYLVENVERERFRMESEFHESDVYDHLDPESEVVSYEFEGNRIYKHSDENKRDIKYFIPFENPIWLTSTKGSG